MPDLGEIISDFSGGVVDQVDSERLADNQSEFWENFEYRDQILRTRRGSRVLDASISTETVKGAGLYISPLFEPDVREYILLAQGSDLYRANLPFLRERFLTLPDEILDDDDFEFVQAIDKVYIFRGENRPVWKWSGDENDSIEAVTESTFPTSDRPFYIFNRFWIITGRETINISDILSENFNSATHSINIRKGDGQKLIALHEFGQGDIVAFKDRSLFIILGGNGAISNASNDLTINQIDDQFGCAAAGTVQKIGEDLWFLSHQGVMSLRQNQENNIRLVQIPISRPIQKIIDRINRNVIDKSEAIIFDNYYICAVPLDNHVTNNTLIVYDFLIKQWVGIFRIRDSVGNLEVSNLPAFSFFHLLTVFKSNKQLPIAIGRSGEIVELFTNDYTDLCPDGMRWIEENNGSTEDYFDSTNLDITQSTGMLDINVFVDRTISADLTFVSIVGTGSTFTLATRGATMKLSASIISPGGLWILETTNALEVGRWNRIVVVQDGVEPQIFINSSFVPQSFVLTTDSTVWFDDFTAVTSVKFGEVVTTATNSDLLVESFGIYGLTGKDDIVAFFPLNEGTGTTVAASNNASITASAVGTIAWNTVATPSQIYSRLLSTSIFNESESQKLALQGEYRITQRNSKVSLNSIRPDRLSNEELIDQKTYSEITYITGITNWDTSNSNDDHDADYRENYSPLNLPSSGILLTSNGIQLEYEVEFTQHFNPDLSVQRLQFEFINEQGTVGLRSIGLIGQDKGFGKVRSL